MSAVAPGSVSVPVRRVNAERDTHADDEVAVEEPLLIELAWPGHHQAVAVTMRTPGADEDLALGFLFGEGIVTTAAAVAQVTATETTADGARVIVELNRAPPADALSQERNFFMTSSCGVCGKAALEAVRMRSGRVSANADFVVAATTLHRLPVGLRDAQQLFAGTGSLHAAAAFTAAGVVGKVHEDVGRHNALDKLVGTALRDGRLPLADHGVMVSGRASFELVQKACMAGVPLLAAVGAPSSLAIELAWEAGMTLVGFVRDERFNVYTGPARVRT